MRTLCFVCIFSVSAIFAQDSRGIPDPLRRLLAEGSYEELRGLVEKALKSSLSESDRLEYVILIAETELAAGQIAKARDYARRAQEKALQQEGPGSSRLQLLKARIDRVDQRPLEAALELQRLLLSSQDLQCKFEAAIELGLCLEVLKRFEEATQAWNLAEQYSADLFTDRSDPRVTGLMQLMQQAKVKRQANNTSADEALYVLAMASIQQHQYEDAMASFAELVRGFSASQYADEARYRIGECLQLREKYAEAFNAWKDMVRAAPTAPWRGQALLGMIDIAIEQQMDLKLANELLDSDPSLSIELQALDATWSVAHSDLRLRLALVRYIEHNFQAAEEALRTVKQLAVSSETVAPEGWHQPPSPIATLVSKMHDGEALVPEEILDADFPNANLRLTFAEFYTATKSEAKAERLFSLVARDRTVKASQTQRAYALVRLADNYHWSGKNEMTYNVYLEFVRDYRATDQAACIWLRKAVHEYSQQKNPKLALMTLSELETLFPRAEEAESACVFRCTILQWEGDTMAAQKAYLDLVARYPNGMWSDEYGPNFLKNLDPQPREPTKP